MSQRLLICLKENVDKEKDNYFDAIFSEDSDLRTLLEWVDYTQGLYLGPWKITVRDIELINIFNNEFNQLCKVIDEINGYEDIWFIYYKDKGIEHPTIEEVREFLDLTAEEKPENK